MDQENQTEFSQGRIEVQDVFPAETTNESPWPRFGHFEYCFDSEASGQILYDRILYKDISYLE